MPTVKKVKRNGAAKPDNQSKPHPQASKDRPTPAEVEEEEHPFVHFARKHWLKQTKKRSNLKVNHAVLKDDLYDPLEREGFQYKSLLLLENLQTLEG